MPIIRLISQSSFDPDMTNILTTAFDTAWERIKNSGIAISADCSAASAREALAKHIIAMAQAGERDGNRLVDRAVAYIAAEPPGRKFSPADILGSAKNQSSIADTSK
jgi:hypothetical protein